MAASIKADYEAQAEKFPIASPKRAELEQKAKLAGVIDMALIGQVCFKIK
jgi:hypothetical protein